MIKVELRPQVGKNVISHELVRCQQYMIFVDGKHCGFVPFSNPRPLLFMALGPIELEELQKQIAELLPAGTALGDARTAKEPPEQHDPEDEPDPIIIVDGW